MKKIASLLIIGTLALSGCESAVHHSAERFDGADFLCYQQENVCAFDVDDNGNVYSAAYDSDKAEIYNTDGTFIEEITLPAKNVVSLAVNDGSIYSLYANALYKNDEIIYKLPFEDTALCLEITDGYAYILYDDYDADLSESPVISLVSAWSGESLLRINLADNTAEEIHCGYPLLMSAAEDTLWLYCCDDNGCYITGLYDNTFSEPTYTDIGMLNSFCALGENRFVIPDFSEDTTPTLAVFNSEAKTDNQLMPNSTCFMHGGIKYFGGYIYYINNYAYAENCGKIERIKERVYAKDNITINTILPEGKFYEPFGCGRRIKSEMISTDEFALSVLSQDSNYDLCVLSSDCDFSYNICDKGSFYALNDVDGVAEYIEKCFPSMRSTAVNEHGEIWALPLNLTTYCVIYNEKNCAANGIDVDSMSFDELVQLALEMYSADPLRTDISVDPAIVCELTMTDYLSGRNTDLNSEEFRSAAEYCKSIRWHEENSLSAHNSAMQTFGDSLLFMLSTDKSEQFQLAINPDIRARSVSNGNTPADCVYLCVNPATDNLDTVLEYITDLCGYISGKQNNYTLTDKTLYSAKPYTDDMYDIYSRSDIYFRLPDDIIADNLEKYINGEKPLDEIITESERRLSAYLKE